MKYFKITYSMRGTIETVIIPSGTAGGAIRDLMSTFNGRDQAYFKYLFNNLLGEREARIYIAEQKMKKEVSFT